MANKLTNEKLKELIKEILSEKEVRIKVPLPPDTPAQSANQQEKTQWLKDVGVANNTVNKDTAVGSNDSERYSDAINKVKTIAKADGDPTDFTNIDMDKALAASGKESQKLKAFAKQIANQSKGAWANYRELKLDADPSKIAKKGTVGTTNSVEFETSTLTKPRFYTAPNDDSSGKFLGSQNALINSIFEKETIVGRLRQLDKLTNDIFFDDQWYKNNKDKPRELMQAVMLMDLMTHMVKETSGYGSDVFFEAFCALICGGKVTGGSMGGADFETKTGQLGSSKFYQTYYNITQASSNFAAGMEIHYVIAIRKGQENQQSAVSAQVGGETKAQNVTYVDLHYIIVQCTEGKLNEEGAKILTYNFSSDKPLHEKKYKKGKIDIIGGDGADPKNTYIGTIRLLSGGVPWQTEMENNLEDGSAKQAFEASKQFFDRLFKAEEQSKKYISLKKDNANDIITSANAALTAYDEADGFMKSMIELLAPGSETVQGDKGSRQLKKENKKSQTKSIKDLDKLIERVILESMNKK